MSRALFTWFKHLGRSLADHDQLSGTPFLVDTGSEVSVIRPQATDRRHEGDNLTLKAVNNTPITT